MAFLTGHSGAGKSTLLKLISLIERPSYGQSLYQWCGFKPGEQRSGALCAP